VADEPDNSPPPIPAAPAFLDDAAQAEWARIIPELIAADTISRIDRAALAVYCTAYSRWLEAEKHVKDDGMVVKVNGAPVANPYLAIAGRAMEQMRRFLREFGLSPSSRV
jgi:P27 family predicted phage terminase small subunit